MSNEVFNVSKCLKHLKDMNNKNKIPKKEKLNIKIEGKYCYVNFEQPIEIKDDRYEEVTNIYHNVSGIRIDDWCFGLIHNDEISGEFFLEDIDE